MIINRESIEADQRRSMRILHMQMDLIRASPWTPIVGGDRDRFHSYEIHAIVWTISTEA